MDLIIYLTCLFFQELLQSANATPRDIDPLAHSPFLQRLLAPSLLGLCAPDNLAHSSASSPFEVLRKGASGPPTTTPWPVGVMLVHVSEAAVADSFAATFAALDMAAQLCSCIAGEGQGVVATVQQKQKGVWQSAEASDSWTSVQQRAQVCVGVG